jgi:parvulin-like peptidyl-prolyl isomerase
MIGNESSKKTVLAGGTGAAILVAAGLLAAFVAAGAGEDVVVAKVGPRVITRAEFDEQAQRQEVTSAADADSVKRALLDALIQKELLVLEAKERGYFDARVDSAAAAFGADLLGYQLRGEESQFDSTVTEAEIADAFARSRDEIRMRHIIHWSRATVDSARRRIDAGEPFATVASDVSIDTQTAPAGGLLPWLTDRQLIGEFRRALDPVTSGRVVGPFESAHGWHVAVVDSIRRREGADLDQERETIQADILANRQTEKRNAILGGFRTAHHFEFDDPAITATLDEAESAFRGAKEDSVLRNAPFADKWRPLEPGRVLATYDEGRVLVSDYKNHIVAGGPMYVPRRLSPVGIRADVREIFYRVARLAAAKERGLDQDPEWKRKVALKREELAVDRLYSDIMQDARFTDADLQAYYDGHVDQFQQAETLRYSFMEVDDPSVAQWLVEGMEPIAKVAFDTTRTDPERQQASVMFDSLAAEARKTGHLVRAVRDSGKRETWTTAHVGDAAREMKPGDVGHVVESDGLHVVFIFIDRAPQQAIPFAEARERVERTLMNTESEKRLKATLTDLERKYGVERHPERLGLSQG